MKKAIVDLKKSIKEKGISLIVLVITIIVVIILAGVVIISLMNNNPINGANEAVFKNNVSEYRSQLNLWLSGKYTETTGSLDKNTVNYSGQEAKDQGIISFKTGDESKFNIEKGELAIVEETTTEEERAWFAGEASQGGNNDDDNGQGGGGQQENVTPKTIPVNEADTGTPLTESASVSGRAYSYNNPIIPGGFYPVNTTDASWDLENGVPKGWNNGLVIRDSSANEFVWVPVDGAKVRYEKWSSNTSSNQNYGISDSEIPAGVSTERYQVAKYEGFYVARFEVSYDTGGVAASKRAKTPYQTAFFPAKTAIEKMTTQYSYVSAKAGIVTETQWDTMMIWFENSGIDTTRNYTSWGNTGTVQPTGSNEAWKAKNIYDISGNAEEMTNGVNNGNVSYRNASAIQSNSNPYRGYGSLGSRATLFIL